MIAVLAFLFLAGRPPAEAGRWLAWAALLGPGVPSLYAFVAFASGRTTSVFIPDRRQRVVPLLLAFVSSTVGTWVLLQLAAPDYAVQLMAAYACAAVIAALVSCWWAISLHVAGLIIPWGVGVVAVDGWYLVLLPIPFVVGWARVREGEHTSAQVVAGGLAGAGSVLLGNTLVMILGI